MGIKVKLYKNFQNIVIIKKHVHVEEKKFRRALPM